MSSALNVDHYAVIALHLWTQFTFTARCAESPSKYRYFVKIDGPRPPRMLGFSYTSNWFSITFGMEYDSQTDLAVVSILSRPISEKAWKERNLSLVQGSNYKRPCTCFCVDGNVHRKSPHPQWYADLWPTLTTTLFPQLIARLHYIWNCDTQNVPLLRTHPRLLIQTVYAALQSKNMNVIKGRI